MLTIHVPGAPQGKGRPRFRIVKTLAGKTFGSTYTPAKTRKYENFIASEARDVMQRRPPLEGPLLVRIDAYMEVPKSWSRKKRDQALTGVLSPTTKPDFDNIAKLVDALKGIVWIDDSQVVDCRIVKSYSETPALVIQVTPVESALTAVTGARVSL